MTYVFKHFRPELGWVKFLLLGSGRVSHLWFEFGSGKFSPKNPKFFNSFHIGSKKSHWVVSKSTRVKDGLASYLLRVKSMLRSGQGPCLVEKDSWSGWDCIS